MIDENTPHPGPIGITPFRTNTTRGYELTATDENVLDVPLARVARKADAILYAAAPDMLAALQMIESCLAPDDNDAAAQAVRAAIARATGKEG